MSAAIEPIAETEDTQSLLALLPEAAAALDALHVGLRAPFPAGFTDSQTARHGRAWAATYIETLRSLADYSQTMQAQNRLGPLEAGLDLIVAGEYLNQLAGGLVMSQNEIMRPQDMGLPNPYRI